ncbi:hypothetical protein WA026_003282 [Henosepilachna vigintioctopunctata]|uniref:Major facilitator superfamily (MFS) profile domain-containing protein n=1 Tax=Henosepilachna vigintioctopunctata TaxID=420089 RepID=A0AAW1TJ93_9CUCU
MRIFENSMRFRMFLSVFLGSSMMIITGCNLVWASPLIKKLKSKEESPLGIALDEDEASFLTALSVLGSIAGCIIFGALAQRMSRRLLLAIVCVPFLIHYIIMAVAKVLWLYFIARFICGAAIGGVITLLPPYICEIADPKIRGKLCVSIGLCKNIGTLITYSVGPYISFYWYHMILALMPITFSILFYLFALESPYYMFLSSPDDATRILRELTGKQDVTSEIGEIKRGIHNISKEDFLSTFKSSATLRSVLTGMGLSLFTQFSGYLVLMSFAVFVFDEAGGSFSSEVDTILIAVTELITSVFAPTVTDHLQRKTQFILSYSIAGLCHSIIGAYFIIQGQGVDVSNLGSIPLLCIAGYFVMYDLGMGILTQTILGELFPPAVKSTAVALCQIVASSVGFILTISFTRVEKLIGTGETFWIFAIFSFCGAIFVKLRLVETRGKTLEQVQDHIHKS